MSLARTTNPIGKAIIRRLGDSSGALARDVESELDNLIAWAKDARRRIHKDTASTGNVGSGLDTIRSISIPAASLASDGDELQIHISGSGMAGGSVQRRWAYSFDSQSIADFTTTINTTVFTSDLNIMRLSATTVRVSGLFVSTDGFDDTGDIAVRVLNQASLTVANLNSNAVTLLVQGEHVAGSSNNVVLVNKSVIYLTQT